MPETQTIAVNMFCLKANALHDCTGYPMLVFSSLITHPLVQIRIMSAHLCHISLKISEYLIFRYKNCP